MRARVKERENGYWQQQLTPNPKPEARPEARFTGAARLVPVKPEQLFWLLPVLPGTGQKKWAATPGCGPE